MGNPLQDILDTVVPAAASVYGAKVKAQQAAAASQISTQLAQMQNATEKQTALAQIAGQTEKVKFVALAAVGLAVAFYVLKKA